MRVVFHHIVLAALIATSIPSLASGLNRKDKVFLKQFLFFTENFSGESPNKYAGSVSGFAGDSASSWCGPGKKKNTIVCLGLPGGQEIKTLPIPGDLTTLPLFLDKSWVFGTAKGVLIRLSADRSNKLFFPVLPDKKWVRFWGTKSREHIQNVAQAGLNLNVKSDNRQDWETRVLGEFIGNPVVIGNTLAILNANQYLYGFEWTNGNLKWTYRLDGDSGLRMENHSLSASPAGFILGQSDGSVVIIDPTNGTPLWKHKVTQTQSNQGFHGIVARAWADESAVLVSNAESVTEKIRIRDKKVLWSFPMGSVAPVKKVKDDLIVSGADGRLALISFSTGIPKWQSSIFKNSGVFSAQFFQDRIVVVSQLGELGVVNYEDGKILSVLEATGKVASVQPYGQRSLCVSSVSGSLRCFEVVKN